MEWARLPFTARIVVLTPNVRDMRDDRDGPNRESLVDSLLRVSHRKAEAKLEVEG
jgi:hypothetical protein